MGILKKDTEKVYTIYSERELKVLSFQAFGTLCKVKFPLCDSINHKLVFEEIVCWVSLKSDIRVICPIAGYQR